LTPAEHECTQRSRGQATNTSRSASALAAKAPTPQSPADAADGRYGAHWWLDIGGPGSFSANGYDGQYIVCVPDLDLVLVRHGATPLDKKEALKAWVGELIDCFRR
jgi:CubicO group peptidase (beta-lactamase class C family)